MDHFIIQRRLGKGSYGTVSKVMRKCDLKPYAIKEVQLHRLRHNSAQGALNEVRLLASLKHPHIIPFYEAFVEGPSYRMILYIVMEYASYGDLARSIRYHRIHKRSFPESRIWKYMRQLSDALSFLHIHNILHRDVKPANCFLQSRDIIKLGDLNISRIVSQNEFAKTKIGTPLYMGPEIWSARNYDVKCDVWSLGCILYEMMTLKPPFDGRTIEQLSRKVCRDRLVPMSTQYSTALRRLVLKMLHKNPVRRPTMKEVYEETLSKDTPSDVKSPNPTPSINELPIIVDEKCSKKTDSLLETIRMIRNSRTLTNRLPPSQYKTKKKVPLQLPSIIAPMSHKKVIGPNGKLQKIPEPSQINIGS